ncbi:MAG: cell division protein FtsQ/DivIB [Candidatus Omnitrophica bacterium]|nr:cell division protein FtsQ/DivIB [Candidatus Omnitrophota bacterium]
MRKQKFNLPVRIVFVLAIILLAISFVIGYIWKALTTSEFFSVKQIIVRNSDISFNYLKGRNIFSLDLFGQSRKVSLGYPDCRKVRLTRVFPNCIFVDFLKRQPVALVKFYKNFVIDDQGFLFYPELTVEEAQLPVIYGLETKIFAPKAGVKYNRPEVELALTILKEFKVNKGFTGFTLKKIDVSNLQSAGFFLLLPKRAADYTNPNPVTEWMGFEVRIGEANIREKMMILGGLIMQARKEWPDIKYIDLRFKEPIIKLNNKP